MMSGSNKIKTSEIQPDKATCMTKVKSFRWWIIAAVGILIIVGVVLGVTLGKKKPAPQNLDLYNPYVLQDGSLIKGKGVMTGRIIAQKSKLDALNSQVSNDPEGLIQAAPRKIATG